MRSGTLAAQDLVIQAVSSFINITFASTALLCKFNLLFRVNLSSRGKIFRSNSELEP
jgi:hypothetical protein